MDQERALNLIFKKFQLQQDTNHTTLFISKTRAKPYIRRETSHYGTEQPDSGASNHPLSQKHERSEQCRGNDWCERTSNLTSE